MDRMASLQVYRSGLSAVLLVACLFQQGCLAAAWVAAVGTDSMRTSSVTFGPFESSWVSAEKPGEIMDGASLSSLAVMPVEGDADMGRRLAAILQQQTALRVKPDSGSANELSLPASDEAGRSTVARAVSRTRAVDAVLFGRVSSLASHPSDWGWKDRETRRLFLYLVDRDGHLLWKDELPYTVVTGSKPLLEGPLEASLSHHLMEHVRDLGLDALGYLPQKTS